MIISIFTNGKRKSRRKADSISVSYTHLDVYKRQTYRRESAMAGISTEIKQREPAIAETEQRITELEQQLEKGRLIDERIKKLKERRSKMCIRDRQSIIIDTTYNLATIINNKFSHHSSISNFF